MSTKEVIEKVDYVHKTAEELRDEYQGGQTAHVMSEGFATLIESIGQLRDMIQPAKEKKQ